MYGRYTQELGVYAKEEAARLRDGGQRRSLSERSRTLDLLEYDKGRCAKCRSKFHRPGFSATGVNGVKAGAAQNILLILSIQYRYFPLCLVASRGARIGAFQRGQAHRWLKKTAVTILFKQLVLANH